MADVREILYRLKIQAVDDTARGTQSAARNIRKIRGETAAAAGQISPRAGRGGGYTYEQMPSGGWQRSAVGGAGEAQDIFTAAMRGDLPSALFEKARARGASYLSKSKDLVARKMESLPAVKSAGGLLGMTNDPVLVELKAIRKILERSHRESSALMTRMQSGAAGGAPGGMPGVGPKGGGAAAGEGGAAAGGLGKLGIAGAIAAGVALAVGTGYNVFKTGAQAFQGAAMPQLEGLMKIGNVGNLASSSERKGGGSLLTGLVDWAAPGGPQYLRTGEERINTLAAISRASGITNFVRSAEAGEKGKDAELRLARLGVSMGLTGEEMGRYAGIFTKFAQPEKDLDLSTKRVGRIMQMEEAAGISRPRSSAEYADQIRGRISQSSRFSQGVGMTEMMAGFGTIAGYTGGRKQEGMDLIVSAIETGMAHGTAASIPALAGTFATFTRGDDERLRIAGAQAFQAQQGIMTGAQNLMGGANEQFMFQSVYEKMRAEAGGKEPSIQDVRRKISTDPNYASRSSMEFLEQIAGGSENAAFAATRAGWLGGASNVINERELFARSKAGAVTTAEALKEGTKVAEIAGAPGGMGALFQQFKGKEIADESLKLVDALGKMNGKFNELSVSVSRLLERLAGEGHITPTPPPSEGGGLLNRILPRR
jgi:hypothetical protein